MTTYTHRKTGATYTFAGTTDEGHTLLKDEQGEKVVVAESTFKRWFKKETVLDFTAAQEEPAAPAAEPKKEKTPLTGHQKIAAKNIRHAFNWILGGWENAVQDGHMEALPPVEEMLNHIYDEALTSKYDDGCAGGKAPEEMRFAGTQFCRKYLARLFEKDGYEVPEGWVDRKEKSPSKTRAKTTEEQNWGLPHHRMTTSEFEAEFGLTVNLLDGGLIGLGGYKRSVNWNPLTGCAWFRFKNEEYELTDMDDAEQVSSTEEEA